MAEEQARQLAERVAALEAELQATLQANAELNRGIQEQREIAETAQLRADRCGRAQMQDFANLTAELIAGRRGPEVQMENVRIGVKMERPEYFEGNKTQDVDTWLFQVREHLDITVIPERGHVPYLPLYSMEMPPCGGENSVRVTNVLAIGMIFAVL